MKTIVVLPAYNCATTLKKTIDEIPLHLVDDIVLVDDASSDDTLYLARKIGIKNIYRHQNNLGYGANQKTCYDKALELNADVVIMLHPDYQYNPKLISDILFQFKQGAEIVFASRMQNGNEALRLGMPFYKFVSNKFLTFFQNVVFCKKLSEYHTGYRAYSSNVLKSVDYKFLSNDFIFDNEFIIECFKKGFNITEISCPARYEKESSSINFKRSLKYGCMVIINTIKYALKI